MFNFYKQEPFDSSLIVFSGLYDAELPIYKSGDHQTFFDLTSKRLEYLDTQCKSITQMNEEIIQEVKRIRDYMEDATADYRIRFNEGEGSV